jgi:outer membrane receptor protein involved in Fe transport
MYATRTTSAAPVSLRPSVILSATSLSGLLLTAGPLAASASPVQPKPQEQAPVVSGTAPAPATVSVSAERPTNRIDRQVYDVKADPATSNDSVADTLNKVPSVAVDPDGNVSLRGRNNVQILVDGKPSAMMQGENRASALSALPAADLESVEVINNPGAEFGNEGGGGPIINLVMRRERRPGGFASVNANVGTEGRRNASAFGSYTSGRMSLQGSVHGRGDLREERGENRRQRFSSPGVASGASTQSSANRRESDGGGVNGTLSYNLGDKDTLGLAVSYFSNASESAGTQDYRGTRADGAVDNAYVRTSASDNDFRNYSLSGRLEHKGELRGELLKFDLRLSGSDAENEARYANHYTVRPPTFSSPMSRQSGANETRVIDFTSDYERPLASGLLKLGYKLARTRSVFDNGFFDIDPASLLETVNTTRTNRFELDDTTYAVYGSYQMRLSEKWSVLGGLRAEYNELDMDQVTTRIQARNTHFDAIPSAFVTYGLSDDTTLRLSYAHRIRRPGAGDLNPFVVYRDELNIASGNPSLKPSGSDSLELGVETRLGKVETNVRLYARRDSDLISERRFLLGGDVLLTTRENAGSNKSGGLEFSFRGKATDKLTINANGNLGYTEQTVLGSATGREDTRSATSIAGRVRLNYAPDPANQYQLSVNAQGKTLFGEGYRQPVRSADFNYRRIMSPTLSVVLNVNDLFDSQKMESVTETERLREYSVRRFNGRTVFLGLSFRFGGFAGGGQRGPGMGMGPRPMGGPGGA